MTVTISIIANLFLPLSSQINAAVPQIIARSGADELGPNQTAQGQPVRPETTDDRNNNQVRFLLMILVGLCMVIGYAVLMFSLYKRYARDAVKRGRHSQGKGNVAGKRQKSAGYKLKKV